MAAVAAGFERIPSFFLYGEAAHEEDERLVHVETIAFRSARHHWKIRPHLHRRLHQLILVLRGCGVSLAEGSSAEFRPPALIAVPAGAVHGFDFEPGTQGFVVSMADELLREITRREGAVAALFENPATFELDATALKATELTLSFEMLSREFSRTLPGHTLALEGLLTVILANGLRLSQVSVESAESGVGHRRLLVSRFRELVERVFREDWALADYASALKVSASRLRTACLEVTGSPPLKLVHARLLLEAKRQLRYTSASVSEIAYELGFNDPAYFTRFFSRRTGASPSEFRSRSSGAPRFN